MATRSSPGKSNAALDPALPQKKRARRRLVGAAAVCLAVAILLPMLLDSEPRQIRGDVEVRIPSRDTPLAERADASARSGAIVPADPAQERGAASGSGASSEPDASAASSSGSPAPARDDADPAATPPAAAAEPSSARPREAAPESRQPPAQDPIAALAQAKDPSLAKPGGFIVQIGAFSSDKGAAEQADRARKAGFKAYTESVKTAQGERVRVRIGPFATRAEADQARTRLRAAGVESVLVAP